MMTLHEAASIIKNPKGYWSHDKDEAERIALYALLVLDDTMTEAILDSQQITKSIEDKYKDQVEGYKASRNPKKDKEFPAQSMEAISGVSPV